MSTTTLILEDRSQPWDTVYYRTESCEPAYRAELIDRNKWSGGSTIAVYKAAPLERDIDAKSELTSELDSVPGERFNELATIKLRSMHDDELTINGALYKDNELFKKGTMGWKSRSRDRIWTAPDGREYRWKVELYKPELHLNDEEQTLAAKFHHEHTGALGVHEKCPASLEFFIPLSDAVLDWVMVTFIYLKKYIHDRENASRVTNNSVSTVVVVQAVT